LISNFGFTISDLEGSILYPILKFLSPLLVLSPTIRWIDSLEYEYPPLLVTTPTGAADLRFTISDFRP
jgi:hypothetical protein